MQASSLRRRRITGAHAFFLGALLALFALAPAILPYGGRFVTRGDFIEQQLPFILETRRILRGGLNSYSFNTFLGAPAVGSYAFYTLGSVFVWPLALLPKALIPFGISVMAVLKHAVCALTSFCYLRRMIRDERLALLGCVLYAFSGFTVVNTQFYHFTEVIAFFPLILLGMEDAMGERPRRGLLALFCGLNTLTNYYFMLSSALLAALYFVFRFFSADWKPRRTWQNVFALIFECGVGCALAGVLLCPAMLFMLSITRTGAGDTSLLTQTYTLGTLLERIRAGMNNKRAYAIERLYAHMCCCEDYAVPRLGEEADAERIHYRKLTMRYHDVLSTSPVEIFYCGSLEGGRVARILTDVLSTMPRGEIDEDIGTDIRMNALEAEPRYVTETLPVAQGQLAVGYRLGACMTEPDIPALFVFNALYGGCVTSKLFLNVREKLSLCYYVGSRLSTHKGLLTVTSGIDVKNYERALAAITAQLDAVRTGDFTDGELRSAIRSVASDLRATADAPDALAWYWLNRTVQGLDIDPAEMAALVEEVTRTDVTDIAAGVVCDCVYLLKGTEETADDE